MTARGGIGVSLAGAAALGAYEAGVLAYCTTELARDLGAPVVFDVLAGTSAGAINAAALASTADDPRRGIAQLCALWRGLELADVLRPSSRELLWMLADVTNGPAALRRSLAACGVRGGLFDPRPLRALLEHNLPLARIPELLRTECIRGLAVSTTRVATGEATVFYAGLPAEAWPPTPTVTPVSTWIRIDHVLASASVPLLFPPVEIDGDLYCDGGLRQMVPLAPALRLGADRLLVIDPLAGTRCASATDEVLRREAVASPLYLAGKALNALFADRLEVDLDRVDQLTAILRAGERRYGPGFAAELNAELRAAGERTLAPVRTVQIRPSIDVAQLAVDHALSDEFAARVRGPVAGVIRHLASAGAPRAGDLLAYLLFDGGFAGALIELGRADARARRDDLAALLGSTPAAHGMTRALA